MALEDSLETRTLHEAALEALDHPVLVHDRDTLILFANAAMARHLRAENADSLVGRQVTDFVHPDARPAGEERRALVLDRGQRMAAVPLKLLACDGTLLYARVDGQRIDWDGGVAILIAAHFCDPSGPR